MFSGRVRLLTRFFSSSSSSSSSSSFPFLPAVPSLSFLPPPAAATPPPPSPRRLCLFHRLKKRRDAAAPFCTRAASVAQDEPVSVSSPSSYLSVRVQCSKCDADTLSEALFSFGASSVSKDNLLHSQDHDEIWLTCILASCQDVHTCISLASGSIGLNYAPKYDVSVGEQCDWEKAVQENFHPIEVVTGLWIVPRWRDPPDLQATNIILDPGMAFGTGEHPTTKLCMKLLHSLLKGGEHFLDYGTGSGVLGIAAVKMGAALSVGIDIDSQAVTSARENIALNNIDSNRMMVYLIPNKSKLPYFDVGTDDINAEEETLYNHEVKAAKGKFDVVIANILLNHLVQLAEDVVSYAKPGAKVGLSGILSEQVQELKDAYSLYYLDNISVLELEGWACLSGDRKRNLTL